MVENIRDTTTRSVMSLVTSNQIEIKPEQLQRLIAVINTTIESGFQNGARIFERTVDEQLKAAVAEKKEVKQQPNKKS